MMRQIPLATLRIHRTCLLFEVILLALPFSVSAQTAPKPTPKAAADLARDLADLAHPDKDRRGSAAVRLGRRGTKAVAAVPQLAQVVLSDKSSEVRGYAASALGAIGPAAVGGVDALASAANDADAAVCRRAIVALGEIGPGAARALPVLRKRLADPDPNFRRIAARALGGLAQAAEPAIEELISRMYNDEDGVVCREAAQALGEVGRPLGRVVPVLAEVVEDDNQPLSTRFAAVMALGRIGPGARGAAETLRKVTEDDDTNLAMAAKLALKAVSAGAK